MKRMFIPFIITLTVYLWYRVYAEFMKYPKDIIWRDQDEAGTDEM